MHPLARATYQSSAAGSASDSFDAARAGGVPVRMRFTGTSSFLPDSVRGTAGATSMASGTWRGDSCDAQPGPDPTAQLVVELGARHAA